jgi:hypothetical protein
MLKTLRPPLLGTQRCVDKGLVFIPRLLLAILANPERCGYLEGKQNAMKLGIPLGLLLATWMKRRVRYFGCGKTVVRHAPVYPNSSLRLDHRYKAPNGLQKPTEILSRRISSPERCPAAFLLP